MASCKDAAPGFIRLAALAALLCLQVQPGIADGALRKQGSAQRSRVAFMSNLDADPVSSNSDWGEEDEDADVDKDADNFGDAPDEEKVITVEAPVLPDLNWQTTTTTSAPKKLTQHEEAVNARRSLKAQAQALSGRRHVGAFTRSSADEQARKAAAAQRKRNSEQAEEEVEEEEEAEAQQADVARSRAKDRVEAQRLKLQLQKQQREEQEATLKEQAATVADRKHKREQLKIRAKKEIEANRVLGNVRRLAAEEAADAMRGSTTAKKDHMAKTVSAPLSQKESAEATVPRPTASVPEEALGNVSQTASEAASAANAEPAMLNSRNATERALPINASEMKATLSPIATVEQRAAYELAVEKGKAKEMEEAADNAESEAARAEKEAEAARTAALGSNSSSVGANVTEAAAASTVSSAVAVPPLNVSPTRATPLVEAAASLPAPTPAGQDLAQATVGASERALAAATAEAATALGDASGDTGEETVKQVNELGQEFERDRRQKVAHGDSVPQLTVRAAQAKDRARAAVAAEEAGKAQKAANIKAEKEAQARAAKRAAKLAAKRAAKIDRLAAEKKKEEERLAHETEIGASSSQSTSPADDDLLSAMLGSSAAGTSSSPATSPVESNLPVVQAAASSSRDEVMPEFPSQIEEPIATEPSPVVAARGSEEQGAQQNATGAEVADNAEGELSSSDGESQPPSTFEKSQSSNHTEPSKIEPREVKDNPRRRSTMEAVRRLEHAEVTESSQPPSVAVVAPEKHVAIAAVNETNPPTSVPAAPPSTPVMAPKVTPPSVASMAEPAPAVPGSTTSATDEDLLSQLAR